MLNDSVQSQANRLEENLLAAIADGLPIPHMAVDFSGSGLDGIDRITSLEASHRIYDAILRDSELDGVSFMESEVGQRLARAKPEDASAILEISPTALLFGAWHSTGVWWWTISLRAPSAWQRLWPTRQPPRWRAWQSSLPRSPAMVRH